MQIEVLVPKILSGFLHLSKDQKNKENSDSVFARTVVRMCSGII